MKQAVVAGSIGLDIALMMTPGVKREINSLFSQGKVTNIDGVTLYLGGETGNTGIALSNMGVPVTVVCKIGDDRPGEIVKDIFKEHQVDARIIVLEGSNTTVAITMTPPGLDKISLLSKGAGQKLLWEDVPQEDLKRADLFHFGYPTAMDQLYANDGAEFLKMFFEAKKLGLTTSVDTTLPDLDSDAGKQNWKRILKRVLPYVDIFMPSIEETLFMLDRAHYVALRQRIGADNLIDHIDPNSISEIGQTLLAMGPKIVVIKMGKQGLYLCTASEAHFATFGRALPEKPDSWFDRELWDPAFNTEPILSTTGAGDTAIAGFLAAFLNGDSPEKALEIASMSASLCIGSYDTVSSIGKLSEIDDLLKQERSKLPVHLNGGNWRQHDQYPIYIGSGDKNKTVASKY